MAISIGELVAHIGIDASGFEKGINKFGKRLDVASKDMSGRLNSVTGATSQLTSALKVLTGALGARELMRAADTWKLVAGRISLVTRSSEELAAVQGEVFAISQRTRLAFESTATLYTRVARNADQLGRSQRELLDFTEAVQKSVQVSGASAQEASAGVIQLSQALASGALRGDEFRSVSEQLPAILKVIRDATGKTAGELREMAFAGELTADLVIGSMLKMKDSIDRDFQKVPVTIGQAFTVLRNDLARFVGQTDSATGASTAIAESILLVSSNLHEIARVVGIATAAWIGYRTALITTAAWQGIVAGTRTIRAFYALAQAIGAVNAAALFLTKATVIGRIAQLVFALGAAGAAWFGFNKLAEKAAGNAVDTAGGLASLDEIIRSLTTSTDGLTEAQAKQVNANDDMLRSAQQGTQLARLEGLEQERLKIAFDAVNEAIEARRTLTGQLLSDTLQAITATALLRMEALATSEVLDRLGTGPGMGITRPAGRLPLSEEGRQKSRDRRDAREQFQRGGGSLTPVTTRSTMTEVTAGAEGSGFLGFVGEFWAALKEGTESIKELSAVALAAAVLKPAFDGLMKALGPVLSALAGPLEAVGRIIGEILAPILEVLVIPLELLAGLFQVLVEPLKLSAHLFKAYLAPGLKLVSNVLRVVTIAFSYLNQAMGWFVKALGEFVDRLIPDWLSKAGKGLAEMGQEMIDNAKAARENSRVTDAATEATGRFAAGLLNAARVVSIPRLRHNIIAGSTIPGVPPTTSGGGGTSGSDGESPLTPPSKPGHGVAVNFYGPVMNPEEVADIVGRAVDKARTRGGTTRLAVAF